MKALITAAGQGSRSGLDGKMRKEMLPVYTMREGRIVLRPILDCVIYSFLSEGIKEIYLVLDWEDRSTREYVEHEYPEVTIIYQGERRGFGMAVMLARDYIGDESFILNAGDGIVLDQMHIKSVKTMMDKNPDRNILTLMKVDNPKRYGVASVEIRGSEIRVRKVVEKPAVPESNYALCAFYALVPEVFDYLDDQRSDEKELTPAIEKTIELGKETSGLLVDRNDWISVGVATEYINILKRSLDRCASK
ncbi:Bifunctional protein GlmU [Thermoplasmatales archaeon]|nr:Bifunctional protein GlmU [Thermoplasmatales archaeon]